MGIRMSFKTLHAKGPCGLVLIFLLRTQLSETMCPLFAQWEQDSIDLGNSPLFISIFSGERDFGLLTWL
jgi:hypothetical protein